jgi:hypothetical protein
MPLWGVILIVVLLFAGALALGLGRAASNAERQRVNYLKERHGIDDDV